MSPDINFLLNGKTELASVVIDREVQNGEEPKGKA
jgi:hypothetical protein